MLQYGKFNSLNEGGHSAAPVTHNTGGLLQHNEHKKADGNLQY